MQRGRNVSNENLKEIFEYINNFIPTNRIEERNLIILKYAYIDNMSGLGIAKLNDSRIIGLGNRNYGKPLNSGSIIRIIKSYNLEYEKSKDYSKRNNYKRRKTITNNKQQGKYKQPKQCAICGVKEDLQLHHIIPICYGGKDIDSNLIYVCKEHHKQLHRNIEVSLLYK